MLFGFRSSFIFRQTVNVSAVGFSNNQIQCTLVWIIPSIRDGSTFFLQIKLFNLIFSSRFFHSSIFWKFDYRKILLAQSTSTSFFVATFLVNCTGRWNMNRNENLAKFYKQIWKHDFVTIFQPKTKNRVNIYKTGCLSASLRSFVLQRLTGFDPITFFVTNTTQWFRSHL